MGVVTVYGHSDDLVEIAGDISDEVAYDGGNEPMLLTFPGGTILSIRYSVSGVWRITPVHAGEFACKISLAVEDDEDNYTDRVTLDYGAREGFVVVGGKLVT